MNTMDNEMLFRQFAAAIDMLGNALRDCPDELWDKMMWGDPADPWIAAGSSKFWYVGSHALFWLDLYLSGPEDSFHPPEPFDLSEMDPQGRMPRMYSREELLGYLDYCREKCKATILSMTSEEASRVCRFGSREMPFAELQLYNMRHVQEHGAQLHMFLGQQAGKAAKWVARGK